MAITSIKRDWGVDPAIVRITSTDTLSDVGTEDYLLDQADNIIELNSGPFDWEESDSVLVYASDGSGMFTISSDENSLTPNLTPDNVLQFAIVPITAAQFNGMYAAPIELVAAPGANKLLILDRMQLLMTYNSAAYASGGVTAVQWDSTINGAGVIASTTIAAAAFQATASTGFNFNAGVVVQPFTTTVNKGLYLSNITGAFTTGNSPMVAHVYYKTIATV